MNKKLSLSLLVLICALCCVLGLVACGEGNHQHKYAWKNDETKHWQECQAGGNCDQKIVMEQAHFDGDYDGECDNPDCRYAMEITVNIVSLDTRTLRLALEKSYTLTATLSPSNSADKTLTWTSSNSAIASVDANGKVTAVSAGVAIITARASSGANAECEVTVYDPSAILEYAEITSNGSVIAYSVKKVKDGFANDITEIQIPATYNGKPITAMDSDAFSHCGRLKDIYYMGTMANWCDISFANAEANPLHVGTYSNNHGVNLYIDNELVTDIVIPDTVTSIKDYAFYGYITATSVTLPNGLASIGKDAFAFCSKLESINVPDGATEIAERAFYYCNGLKTVTLPNSITTIGEMAFCECPIESATIPAVAAKHIHSEYSNSCTLQSVEITSGTIKSHSFYCPNLTNATFGDGVKVEYEGFNACQKLKSITLRGSVELAYEAIKYNHFQSQAKLSQINLMGSTDDLFDSEFNDLLRSIDAIALWNGTEFVVLESITLPTDLNYNGQFDFVNCIKEIVIPYGVTISKGFVLSSGLTTIKTEYSQDEIAEMFSGTFADSSVDVQYYYGVKTGNENGFDYIIRGGIVTLTNYNGNSEKVTLPQQIEDVAITTLGTVLQNNTIITDVTIPSGYTEIADKAFSGCVNLETVTIPDSVTSIAENAFENCPKFKGQLVNGHYYVKNGELTEVKDLGITAIIPSSVTKISVNAFKNTTVKYVYIPESVATIETDAFADTSVIALFYQGDSQLGVTQGSRYMSVGYCTADGWIYTSTEAEVSINAYIGIGGEVSIPAQIDGKPVTQLNVKQQGPSVLYAFLQRGDITKITINSNTLNVKADALKGLANLAEISLAETVAVVNMTKSAFDGCNNLTAISLAGGYDKYEVVVGNPTSSTSHNVTDSADVLSKLNNASSMDACSICLKEQA